MKVLLLGYSDIVRRRILPALHRAGIDEVDIASYSSPALCPEHRSARLFGDYDEALRRSDASLVYVSTVNSLHATWARAALRAGFHVLVDKPACLDVAETNELVDLAERKGACLAEVITYYYHPQIKLALAEFERVDSTPTHILAAFSFPPLPADNFRYRADLGGGALWDLGPYAATVGRIFFANAATEMIARITQRQSLVDTSFSMIASYPGGHTCVGSFGFTTGYLNRLHVCGSAMVITIDRAFTPPPDQELALTVRHLDGITMIPVPASDSFALFFQDVLAAIASNDVSAFSAHMLADAQALARLRTSARERELA